jgi:ATP-dependent DNA helicase RecG
MAASRRSYQDPVATTVIEVGVDVRTQHLVIERRTLRSSQLHQLRGRVGRGSAQLMLLHALPS